MNHGSVFTGIGGFDLAAECAGYNNIFSVENDEFCDKILRIRFPGAERNYDIKETDFKKYRGTIDVLTGGVPCQPYSVAGKRKGIHDDRFLWEEFFRALREGQPPWAIAENVLGITSMAFKTLFSQLEDVTISRTEEFDDFKALYTREEKMLIEYICEGFEKEGYEVQPFNIPACGKGAWHRRYRVWFVAYSESARKRRISIQQRNKGKEGINSNRKGEEEPFTNSDKFNGNNSGSRTGKISQHQTPEIQNNNIANSNGERFKKQREEGKFKSNNVMSNSWWEFEPGMDRMANGIPNRVDRLKGLGNAVVPQIPFEFFKMIKEVERCLTE